MSQPEIGGSGAPRGSSSMKVHARMRVVEDTPSRIVLRYTGVGAVVFAALMLAGAAAALRFLPGRVQWLVAGMLLLFVLIAGVGGMWRDQLEIDLGSGQWRRRAGFAGRVKETRGTLADFGQVTLVLNRRAASDDASPTWEVSIAAPQWVVDVVLESTLREQTGYASLRKWSEKLRLDAVDRSGDEESRSEWNRVDRPILEQRGGHAPARAVASRTGDPASLTEVDGRSFARSLHPPPRSRIVVTQERGGSRIALPPTGWNAGATFVTLFGTLFGGVGGAATLAALDILKGIRVNGRILDGPDWGFAAFSSVFLLIGVAIVMAMIVGTRASETIEDAGDELLVGFRMGGLEWGRKRLPKRSVLDVDLSAGPTASAGGRLHTKSSPPPLPPTPRDVRIRTDARVVRLGRELSDEEQRWLIARIQAMIGAPRPRSV